MPNRSQTESESIILEILRPCGDEGLPLDKIHQAFCQNGEQSKTMTKKLLQRMKAKGLVKSILNRNGQNFSILPGH